MEEFNRYDVRGKTSRLNVERLARALCFYLLGEEIYLAHDSRVSQKIVEDFLQSYGKVTYLGKRLSPELYFIQKSEPLCGAVMITRSHIKESDIIGFKLMRGERFICDSEIKELETLYAKNNFSSTITAEVKQKDPDIYFETLKKTFCTLKGLNVGTNRVDFALFFHSLKADLVSLTNRFCEPLDALVLSDGDGDRLSVITKNGELSGDALFSFLIIDAKMRGKKGLVLIEEKCSPTLFALCEELKLPSEPVETGHSIIKNRMAEKDALLAGEASGHFYFKERFFIDDALYGALLVLQAIKQGRKVKPWEGLPRFNSGEIRGVARRPFEEKRIFDKERTFAILKKSQTEPGKFVLKVESDSEEIYKKTVKKILDEVGYEEPNS